MPYIQNLVIQKVTSYVSEKTNSDFKVGYIALNFPKSLVIEDISLVTPKNEVLFSAQELEVDIDFETFSLEKIILDEVALKGFNSTIIVDKNEKFNFDYLLEAFASGEEEEVVEDTTASAPLPEIVIHSILIENTTFNYIDSVLNLTSEVEIGRAETSIPQIDLNNSVYDIEYFGLSNSKVNYTQFGPMPVSEEAPESDDKNAESTPFILKLKKGQISNFSLQYNENVINEKALIQIGLYEINDHLFDLEKTIISIENNKLANTYIEYAMVSDTTKVEEPYVKPKLTRLNSLDLGWNIDIKETQIEKLSLKYDDNLYEPVTAGLDPSHIYFQQIDNTVNNLVIDDEKIDLEVFSFYLKEKSGFKVNNLRSDVSIKPRSLKVNNLLLELNNSFIQNDLYLSYPNLFLIGDYPEELYFKNSLKKAHIAFSDATVFDPSLKADTLIQPFLAHDLDLKTDVEGDLSKMTIDNTQLSTSLGISTYFKMDLANVMSDDSLSYSMSIDSLQFYTPPLLDIFLDSAMQEDFRIPRRIQGNIGAQGGLTHVTTQSQINIFDNGYFTLNFDLKNEDEYSLKTKTYNLDVGRILKDLTIGKISTDFSLRGKGFDVEKDLLAELSFELQKAEYNEYDYKGLSMHMNIDRQSAKWKANADREAMNFDLTGSVDMNKEIPTASVNGKVNVIDLYALNLYEDTLSFGMDIESNTIGFDIENLNSTLNLNKIYFIQDKDRHDVSFVRSHVELDSTHFFVNLESEAVTARVESDVTLDSISVMIERYFSQFLSSRQMIGQIPPSKGNLNGYVEIKDSELLTNGTIRDLDSLEFKQCEFHFNAAANTFDFDLDIPKLAYADYHLDSIYTNVHANTERLKYDLGFHRFLMLGFEDYAVHHWNFGGDASNNHLSFKTEGFSEGYEKQWLYLGGHLQLDTTTYRFNLEDKIIVNDEHWAVNKDNYILSDGDMPYVNNLHISKGKQLIKLETTQYDEKDTVYTFQINQFSLDSATYNAQTDTSVINGEINALVNIGNLHNGGDLKADLSVDDFGFFDHILANIKNTASNTRNRDIYENKASIKGAIGDISSEATYNMVDSISPLDLSLDIKELDIASFEKFAKGYASNLSGGFHGDIEVKGLGKAPLNVDGEILMNEPSFKVDLLNISLTGIDGSMVFDNSGIHFNQFGFKDDEGHLAVLKGDIETENYEDFNFNLKFSADDITLINSTSKDNPEYFGKLIVGNLTKIKGPLDHLLIDSDVRISRGTDLTYVYMDGGVGDVDTGEDIINFVEKGDTTVVRSKGDNYEVTATIHIDEQSIFRVVIDPRAGDALTLVGGGTLNVRMDAGDDMVMSGQYTITEGDYSMTFYQLMNKKLKLKKGSSVLWTGDPYNPQANMTAIYEASTSPYPLVANQIEQAEANQYKAKRKFIVYMNMNGDVIKPELSFKLEYPEGSQGGDKIASAVENLNQDESQVNKQVFALLILGTFLNDAGGEGASTSDMVAGSVSSIISQQLNNVTDNLTGGFVDVDFDLDSYSQSSKGQQSNRTDVGVTLKKTLFNDRLSVSVGGKMAVNGNDANNNSNSNSFNTDFLLEYKLLNDGTLKNRLFRSIDAQYFTPDVFKTGVSIVFTKEYNNSKELFVKNLDKKKDIRKRMGMIKRSNSGGGMMKAADPDSTSNGGGMKPANTGMRPAHKDTVVVDSSAIMIQQDSTVNKEVEDTSSDPVGEQKTPVDKSNFIHLFIPNQKNETTIISLAQNDE
ncbi:translocation/assembly module TamB [Flammeovirga aprica JL-4]|uniref:Translocation/assembly module TamB n=1 Tax=Flammeovirga aprica JL-4 TaxID=694437 RepID=A0A7X9P0A5_9BACT|nr:translocation/assembly module TamB domain-containing protein [Flammeovirga aprica]NME67075.1 translocation/assembly module TamB [Flammeovirga aprica JL-4]